MSITSGAVRGNVPESVLPRYSLVRTNPPTTKECTCRSDIKSYDIPFQKPTERQQSFLSWIPKQLQYPLPENNRKTAMPPVLNTQTVTISPSRKQPIDSTPSCLEHPDSYDIPFQKTTKRQQSLLSWTPRQLRYPLPENNQKTAVPSVLNTQTVTISPSRKQPKDSNPSCPELPKSYDIPFQKTIKRQQSLLYWTPKQLRYPLPENNRKTAIPPVLNTKTVTISPSRKQPKDSTPSCPEHPTKQLRYPLPENNLKTAVPPVLNTQTVTISPSRKQPKDSNPSCPKHPNSYDIPFQKTTERQQSLLSWTPKQLRYPLPENNQKTAIPPVLNSAPADITMATTSSSFSSSGDYFWRGSFATRVNS